MKIKLDYIKNLAIPRIVEFEGTFKEFENLAERYFVYKEQGGKK